MARGHVLPKYGFKAGVSGHCAYSDARMLSLKGAEQSAGSLLGDQMSQQSYCPVLPIVPLAFPFKWRQ